MEDNASQNVVASELEDCRDLPLTRIPVEPVLRRLQPEKSEDIETGVWVASNFGSAL